MNRVVGLPGVGLERAEERQDTVAEELRDVAAVLDDGLAHALEVAVEDGHQLGGRESLAELGEPLEVGEQHGDLFLLRARREPVGDDVLDDLGGREAREGLLQPLELLVCTREPPLEARDRPPRAPRQDGQRDERRAQRCPRHQERSTSKPRRQTVFASATTPTASSTSAGSRPSATSRIRR